MFEPPPPTRLAAKAPDSAQRPEHIGTSHKRTHSPAPAGLLGARQPGKPGKPGNPGNPAAPGSTRKCPHIVSAWQLHSAADPANPAPGKPGNPAKTRQHPGNPATRPGNTRQPGNQGSILVGLLKLERPSYRTRLAELALREAHAAFAVQLRLICAFDLTSERLSWMVGLGEASLRRSMRPRCDEST